MKRKLLPKSILVAFMIVSTLSLAYVNIHAGFSSAVGGGKELSGAQAVAPEERESVRVPDVTALAKVVRLVQRFTTGVPN